MSAPPLDLPLYGARFGQAVSRFWRNYLKFSGRASRSEYWWAALFNGISYVVLLFIDVFFGGEHINPATGHLVWGVAGNVIAVFGYLWLLAIVLPTLSITWRRLHDTNRPGGLFFLAFVPV